MNECSSCGCCFKGPPELILSHRIALENRFGIPYHQRVRVSPFRKCNKCPGWDVSDAYRSSRIELPCSCSREIGVRRKEGRTAYCM